MSIPDGEFLERFEAQAIPRAQWTHRSHVKVAYLYLQDLPFEEALQRIRRGIQKLNAANHVEEGPDRGYNETTTMAFAHLIAAVMQAHGQALPCATAEEFCDKHPELMTPGVLRLFYSPGRQAKHHFAEPDLAPLPRIIPAT